MLMSVVWVVLVIVVSVVMCLAVLWRVVLLVRAVRKFQDDSVADYAVDDRDVGVWVLELVPYLFHFACPRASVAFVFAFEFWVR